MNAETKTYNGDNELKSRLLEQLQWHRDQDMLIKGTYGSDRKNGDFKGCAIGCSIHSINRLHGTHISTNSHRELADAIGFPLWLLHLEDNLFEHTPTEYRLTFPERLAEATPVGVDAETLYRHALCPFLSFLLRDVRDKAFADGKEAIDGVLVLLERRQRGEPVSVEEWAAAAVAARAIRKSTWSNYWAEPAAVEAAVVAAEEMAESAAAAVVEAAVVAAEEEVAESAAAAVVMKSVSARQAAHARYADELVRLLESIQVA